ncbi:protein-tyrosine-phosphatase MKP1 [Punica granatum]|uniref:Protein-tyrosine-phosphatase MKP1 n=1 Tax=Punica granatum TaxID=22663 RepID=A0A6P8BQM7_PUNGR|nr:protein-tyrosine-phosphatase MKP1 [Punica granatum]
MVGKEDPNARKTFWRSASWSASRTAQQNPNGVEEVNGSDPNGSNPESFGANRRFPVPLTPRSQQNWKNRSCLPPLQPLSIARRSLDDWPKAGSDDVGEWPQPPTPSGNSKGGERLKLDMSAIQRAPDRNGGLVKREKIAFFDKECSKVAEHIYLGGDAVARDRNILKQNGITHVLNCVGFVCPEYFKADFVYRTLWLQDSPTEDITSILYDVFDYFEDVREQHGRVFVHCCQGVSRSTSLVIAYLMWREGQSFDDAFQFVKAARGIADPNMGFACQLLQCQKRVHAFPLSPSSLLRMYRLAPHSPYDPLHLVPKMLTDPSPSALDSRGAFIVQVPSSIYVWIGRDCEAIMERDARGAVCQIVRYERVQGPVLMIKEGGEPSYFWDAFSNLLPLMDKSGNGVAIKDQRAGKVGERKVDSYDVDFEIFQKAVKGGVVPPFAASENEHETHLPARESDWSMLRRKFAPSNMKEFVSVPKLILSRVYSDSMMVVHSPSSNSPASSTVSSSSSSSSPAYLSPDSISSDSSSSSKYFSESSQNSPSAASCSIPVSSTLSNLCNLSLNPSKSVPQSTSTNSEFIDINFSSRTQPQSASSHIRKLSLSLAERRGSMSRALKLPVMTDNVRFAEPPPNDLALKEDGIRLNGNGCSPSEFHLYSENMTNGVVDVMRERKLEESADAGVLPPREAACARDPSGMAGSVCQCKEQMQLAVYRWPSLEKVASIASSDLRSEAAFAILSVRKGLDKDLDRFVYLWIGRFFAVDKGKAHIGRGTGIDDPEKIDWEQVGYDFLSRIGLPKDTNIKIVREDDEPEEFLALLRSINANGTKEGSGIKLAS